LLRMVMMPYLVNVDGPALDLGVFFSLREKTEPGTF